MDIQTTVAHTSANTLFVLYIWQIDWQQTVLCVKCIATQFDSTHSCVCRIESVRAHIINTGEWNTN